MNLALFDFDGTITFADTFAPFVRFASAPSRVRVGTALLGPMILGYKLGWVAATTLRQSIVRVAFRGRSAAEVTELGVRYSQQALPGAVRPQALERIRWHQAQGDVVAVVSASLDVYLRHWSHALGVTLICAELEARAGVLTGKYVGGDCAGPEKAKRVAAQFELGRYREVFAYGDSSEDRELLALANKRYFRWQEQA